MSHYDLLANDSSSPLKNVHLGIKLQQTKHNANAEYGFT